MFKKDLEVMVDLFKKYNLTGPLLDAGGLQQPYIADYDVSIKTAISVSLEHEDKKWQMQVPHPVQDDRYLSIHRPWTFIDENYIIENPDEGGVYIEELPQKYSNKFNVVILVSVFEHVENPYVVSDALFDIIQPGGYLFNSTPFLFPYHPSPEDNWRFSPKTLQRIHEKSGFKWLEGDFHINISSKEGVGDSNPKNYGAPQAIMASYAFCQKPAA